MGDWRFDDGKTVCDLRVAGVLVREGKLLVQREKDGQEYALPGGHVQIGEETADALSREFREEMGAVLHGLRLLWIEECFWSFGGKQAHQIALYYRITSADGLDASAEEFMPHRDNAGVLFGWLPLDALADAVIYPEFIKQEVGHMEEPVQHFITHA